MPRTQAWPSTLVSPRSLLRLRSTGLRMKAMWTFSWVSTGLQHRSDTSLFSSTLKTYWTDPWIWLPKKSCVMNCALLRNERLSMCEAERQGRHWRLYVQDMCEFSQKVLAYKRGLDSDMFVNNSLIYDAALRNIERIGEAATHLPFEVREAHPEIPWRQVSHCATKSRTRTWGWMTTLSGTFFVPTSRFYCPLCGNCSQQRSKIARRLGD